MTVKYVPDTSVLIDGRITKLIDDGELASGNRHPLEVVPLSSKLRQTKDARSDLKGLMSLKRLLSANARAKLT